MLYFDDKKLNDLNNDISMLVLHIENLFKKYFPNYKELKNKDYEDQSDSLQIAYFLNDVYGRADNVRRLYILKDKGD